ncbi:MAG: sn-glycerol-1-phosphate dehydrogenase [Trueperaceae bacterium]|nr:MAG: sn-glycerol-1-phosphate dehydrogenase [Trueperaceae bacterium]
MLSEALAHASDTRVVRVGTDVLDSIVQVLASGFGDADAIVVADERTFAAAGAAVDAALRAAGRSAAPPIVLAAEPLPYADLATVELLEGRLRTDGAVPVAVGSGTINDLTKLAAHRLGRPYACVATAASMDGYTAFGAAITDGGFKRTMSCPAPRALVADLDVLVNAPPALAAAGYGDLLGKITAGADWILADELEIEAIDPLAWALVQDELRSWTARPADVAGAEPRAIAHLFDGLALAGIAMQVSASSRPASGSEHRFSHLWEMQALATGRPSVAHGFKVAVGTIAVAALYERVLARDLTRLDVDTALDAWPTRAHVERAVRSLHDSDAIAEHALAETLAKHVDRAQLRARLQRLRERWPVLRERLDAQLLPATRVRDLLQAAGCPTDPSAIGIERDAFRQDHARAHTIRARYTVLDLASEAGILDACVAELFEAGGFWGGRPNAAPTRA